ncbi:hypothetical protein V1478_014601 [Vespula squamosa]|uniref:Uncharacterized protein n=1 Tax=Vespula squamosa TaxID=30214 RepID=A0ABD2A2N7_VESSQ
MSNVYYYAAYEADFYKNHKNKTSFPPAIVFGMHGTTTVAYQMHTCITGTSSQQASALAHSFWHHPLALVFFNHLLSVSGRQVFVSVEHMGCVRPCIPSPVPSHTVARQGHVQTHHPILIASELTHIHQLASATSNLVVFVLFDSVLVKSNCTTVQPWADL